MKYFLILWVALFWNINFATASELEIEAADAEASEEAPAHFLFKDWLYCTGEKDVFFEEVQVCSKGVQVAYTVNEDGSQLELECIDGKLVYIANLATNEDVARDWRNYEKLHEKFSGLGRTSRHELEFLPEMSSDRSLFFASTIEESVSDTTLARLRRWLSVEYRVTNIEDATRYAQVFSLAGSAKTIRAFQAECKAE